MNRVQTFAKTMGVGDEEAKAWVEPLSGLTDAAFAQHVAYLSEKKAFMQEKAIAPTPKIPANALAEVVDFMSEFLDAQNQKSRVEAHMATFLPEDDLDSVSENIVEWFASRDLDET